MATFPASLPLGNVITGVVSDVVGALLEAEWDAIALFSKDTDNNGTVSQRSNKNRKEGKDKNNAVMLDFLLASSIS